MKKIALNPLDLNKETIALLDGRQLRAIVGGTPPSVPTTSRTCNGTSTGATSTTSSGGGASTGCGAGSSQCFASH